MSTGSAPHHSTSLAAGRFRSAALIALLGALQLSLSQGAWRLQSAMQPAGPPEEDAVKQSPDLFRALSFGHLPAAVDWLWIRAIGETDVKAAPRPPGAAPLRTPFYRDVDLLTDLDPRFSEIYLIGGNVLAIVQNEGRAAHDLLVKGERFRKEELPSQPESYRRQYWPSAWRLPVLLAYVQLFELGDLPSAAASFKEASQLPGAPAYLTTLRQRLAQPGGEYEVGLRLLDFMITTAREADVREGFVRKRAHLAVAAYLRELEIKRPRPMPERDPWGGHLSVDAHGKVVTTTPHERVFGLD